MRWDDQLLHTPGGETAHLPLFNRAAVVRRFDTPEFRGMTFYEVQAKSIINHLTHDRFGFRHTINPYRGCSHACTYCLDGGTPILMANGRSKQLKDLAVGELVYGTQRRGNYRRYVSTSVTAHWKVVKPAYRIILGDGTQLIASADHRFLTNRGWKHVTGSEHGRLRRPHLTTNNSLLGTGHLAEAPKKSENYKLGYLTGMIRGDANLNTYAYRRVGRKNGDVYRFRLALCDVEGLQRTRALLMDLGIETKAFLFSGATQTRKAVQAIRTSKRGHIEQIRKLTSIPAAPCEEWTRGFLAGIFDAEGSYSRGILRISNSDPELIAQTVQALEGLGFHPTVESLKAGTDRQRPITVVRLLGGVVEHLRFFLSTDPAITRKRQIEGQAIKNKAELTVARIESLDVELPLYDITTGTGDFIADGVVSHNCFARPTHTYLDFDAGRDFETKIVVKTNAPELLRRELRRPSWSGELIAMGTNTDNYQRAEGRYRLMPGILRELNAARNPYSILTKSTLIQRDIDLLVEGASVTEVATAFSVGTVDEDVWRKSEPGTPHPLKRLEVVRRLNEAGVRCGVLMAPILPGISDSPEQLRATVEAIVAAGAVGITPITLYLRPGFREVFMEWLTGAYPELVTPYERMYRSSQAPKPVSQAIQSRVEGLKRYSGFHETGDRRSHRSPRSKPAPDEQLTFELNP